MDAQASEKMYEAYYMRVYSYAVTISGSRELAEEITQETFYRAMTKSASYSFRSLGRIAERPVIPTSPTMSPKNRIFMMRSPF